LTFNIVGLADKRPIIYPLLYVLNLTGHTLLVTDDGAYRRLLADNGKTGYIGNIHIYMNGRISDEILNRSKIDPCSYENVVYALLDSNSDESGFTIYTKQDGSPFREEHPLDTTIQTMDFKTVHIGFKAPTEKGVLFISLNEALLRELHVVENLCMLSPPKNAKVINVLSELLAPMFSCDKKAMRKKLRYKGADRR
jgi:hypothetical protein